MDTTACDSTGYMNCFIRLPLHTQVLTKMFTNLVAIKKTSQGYICLPS